VRGLAPDAEQARSLASWARAHSRTLSPPGDQAPLALRVDASVAEDVERSLDRARDAISAREGDVVDASLAAAETALRAHPELPQAAWLMAEVERTRSTRWRRVPPTDPEAADRAWMRADALDGGRMAGVAEQASQAGPEAATLQLEAIPSGAQAWLDGAAVAATLTTRAGPHALVITWRDAPVWAIWLETPAGSSTVRVNAPPPPPCSSDDLSRVRLTSGSEAVDAGGARCPVWIAASPGGLPGEVRVASCEAERCGPLLPWRATVSGPWSPPPSKPNAPWPAWATWSLVGGGAAIAAGVIILATGALQPPPPSETRFVSGGIKTH
jgi:hypothetical protein